MDSPNSMSLTLGLILELPRALRLGDMSQPSTGWALMPFPSCLSGLGWLASQGGYTLIPFHIPPAQVAGLGPQSIFQSWVMLVFGDTTLHFHLEKSCLLLLVRLEPRPRKQWAPLFYLITPYEHFDG